MYTYPSGLECGVSETRARLYERVVPYLALMMIVGVVPLEVHYLFDWQNVARSIAMILMLWSVWVPSVVLLAFGVFVWWCKPTQWRSSRSFYG